MNKIEKLSKILKESNYIIFFGGAGTSTDSGIKDFRGKEGLYKTKYKGYEPEEILSIDFFMNNRDIFNEYVDEKLSLKNIFPNKGHNALVTLEKMGKLKGIITQNIDNLHQESGSNKVIELHGTLKDWYCIKCGTRKNERFTCECKGIVRPKVTLYGEMLDDNVTNEAIKELKKADTLIIAGTSLSVYPAANYINYFKGKNLIIINDLATGQEDMANLVIHENFSETLEKAVNLLENIQN